jgi:hypothetical protein
LQCVLGEIFGVLQATFHIVTPLEETSEILGSNNGEYNNDFRDVSPGSLVEIYEYLEKCAASIGWFE